jgi:dTDP-4-amino-4,6-dideoxygalactose transaminase
MMRQGRDVRTRQYSNAADLSCFAEFARECPNARTAAERGFLLPTYPRYPELEVEKNIRVMREFFGKATDT